MLREKPDASDDALVRESFETGSTPQIHVSLGALAASAQRSAPAAAEYETVSGD